MHYVLGPLAHSFKTNLALLFALQALVSISAVSLAVVNSLAALQLASNERLATLPVTSFVLGSALSTFFASVLMGRWGRVVGFRIGIGLGMVGALVSAVAAHAQMFWLLCAGAMIMGIYGAFGGYYRFAAAEVAPLALRERAISWVLAAGVVGAIVGPESSKWTRGLASMPFVGTYVSLAIVAGLALLATLPLRLPRMVSGSPLRLRGALKLLGRLEISTAIASAAIGFAVMLFVMTATPIAMHQHHHHYNDTAMVIEWHVLGMYAPSFFTGSLIRRVGVLRVIGTGCALLLGCVTINLLGVSVAHFWVSLVLLGVGWNFMFVGGTTLLSQACTDTEKTVAQGMNEVLILGSNAIASALAGVVLHRVGWQVMSLLALPFLALPIALVATLAAKRRRSATVTPSV
jgi:MFS family permease